MSLGGAIADPDSFYHVGHAAAYLDRSPFDTTLPWAAHSVIGDLGGDLWWGFHLLLLPFAALFGVPDAIRVGGFAVTATLLLTLWLVLRRAGVAWAPFWTVFTFVAVPNALYRLIMLRPHVLSLAAGLALAALLASRRWRWAAAAAALSTLLHASLFWMVGVILAAHLAAIGLERWADRSAGAPWREPVVAALGGAALGMLLRPRPWATLRLVEVQLVELFRARDAAAGLRFGGELTALPVAALVPSSWLLLLPWTAALVALALTWRARAARDPEGPVPGQAPVLATTLALASLVFFALTLTLASRAMAEWTVLAGAATAVSWTLVAPAVGLRRGVTAVLAAATVAAGPWIVQWHATNVRLNAMAPDHLRQVSTWLEERSAPGDLVFHAHWDEFGPLFAWNRTNHYLGGMDPIFQYARDPARWAPVADLAGRGPLTVDPWTVIQEGFAPRWVLVEPFRDPALYEALRTDPRWNLARLTRSEAVFEATGL